MSDKIPTFVMFAYATMGEALEVANDIGGPTTVAKVVLVRGSQIAREPVAFAVWPTVIADALMKHMP